MSLFADLAEGGSLADCVRSLQRGPGGADVSLFAAVTPTGLPAIL